MQCATSVPDDDSTHEHAQMTTRRRCRRPVGRPACALGTWRMLVRNRSPSAKYIEQCGRVLHVAALRAACEQHQFQIFCAGNWERAQTTQHLNSCNHKKSVSSLVRLHVSHERRDKTIKMSYVALAQANLPCICRGTSGQPCLVAHRSLGQLHRNNEHTEGPMRPLARTTTQPHETENCHQRENSRPPWN